MRYKMAKKVGLNLFNNCPIYCALGGIRLLLEVGYLETRVMEAC